MAHLSMIDMMSRSGKMAEGKPKKWIQKAVPESHKGRLHSALGVAKDKPIPEAKLEKAADSTNPHMRHMAQFAENMKGMKRTRRATAMYDHKKD